MNTQDLMNAVVKHQSILVVVEKEQVRVVKYRLSNLRSRQQRKLAEFADDLRLEYVEIELPPDKNPKGNCVHLRISLVPRGKPLEGIGEITVAEDF